MADGEGVVVSRNEQRGVISERWKQAETLFEEALEIGADERSQFVDEISDTELRSEVESLLRAHDEAGAFLDEPERFFSGESLREDAFSPGQVIDRYRIIREIGRGGMGAVFLAERADDQYQKQVAIKLIKRGTDTDSVLRQFRKERQILASLEHPNIARLLDGGTTDDGLPYFVMEHIDGLPIDEYCNTHALSVVERLKLFREVCAAVSHAHRHLVIHRDIKRSNILITAEGVPKLLDFGIAKILQQSDEQPQVTMTAVRPMTPEYASPEQMLGQPVTTASDVYSLGVVLYELLCGRSPYQFTSQSPHEMMRVINDTEPKKPSTAIAGDGNPKLLRGDLDNIVLMALRKEPARRYQSVEQLSEDIRRHLEARPVLARKDTVGYRAAKFVRRNKAALAVAALVLMMLIGGIIATSWQAHVATREKARAERRFNDVRKLANSVLFDYHDAIKNLPGATKVRERLVKDGLNYLDSLAGEAHDDPALQRELAAAYERVGDVRGGESSGSLGDITGARESFTKALTIREALVAVNSDDIQARRDLARSHQKIGRLQHMEDASSGVDHLQKALALYLDLTREQPANEEFQLELASARNRLGQVLSNHSNFAGALEQHRAAFASCEMLAASNPRDPKYLRELWASQDLIGYALSLQNDTPGALEANRKTLALGEALVAADPINADYQRCLMLSYQHGGNYRIRTDKRGALEQFRKAAALQEQILASDPANALIRKDLGGAHKRIAEQLVNLEDYGQALPHFRRAVEIFQKVVADAPTDLVTQFAVATCRAGVALTQAWQGELTPALEECRKAKVLLQEITGDKTAHIGRAQAYTFLGYAYQALAASPKASANDKRDYTSAERDMFRKSADVLDALRINNRGTLGSNEVWAKEIADEIAKCDAALAKP